MPAPINPGGGLFSAGPYEALEEIYDGRYSTIYRGIDLRTKTPVAIKALDVTGRHSDIAFSMFRKEIDALESFQHAHVVRLIDHVASDERGSLLIILEFVPGATTLEKFIRAVNGGRVEKPTLAWRASELANLFDALDKCHQRRVIHRDLNLNNVLVADEGGERQLKLIDFGIAKVLEHYEQTRPGRTLQEFHTPPFAAIEQSRRQQSSYFSDYYAFGLLMASLLTLQVPGLEFNTENLPSFLRPLNEELIDKGLFQEVSSLIKRSLDDEPTLRPRSAEFRRVLERLTYRVTHRPRVGLTLSSKVTTQLQAKGWKPLKVLEDLNGTPVGRYETSPDQRESLVIYGEKLELRVVADQNTGGLVAVKGDQRRETSHQRNRMDNTVRLSREFVPGGGGAETLFEDLYSVFLEQQAAKNSAAERKAHFRTATIIMDWLYDETKEVTVDYRLLNGQPSKNDGVKRFRRDDIIRIKVLDVSTQGQDEPQPLEDWTGNHAQKLSFSFKHLGRTRPVGVFHHFDPTTKVFQLKAEKHIELPVTGLLSGRDIATLVNLKRQRLALEAFAEGRARHPRLDELLLHPSENAVTAPKPRELFDKRLSTSYALIERVLSAQGLFVLQGPPGTGKTTHITEVVAQILKENPKAKVLIASQANEAVNNALDKLSDTSREYALNWRVVRDVSNARQQAGHDEFEAPFQGWVSAVRAASTEAQKVFVRSADPERGQAVEAALADWCDGLMFLPDVRQAYRRSANVYGSTLLRVPALVKDLEIDTFDWVIVDEAAKANDTEVLIPLVLGKKFLLVGDHKQLPPFIKPELETHLQEQGIRDYDSTLFERLYRDITPDCRDRLLVNYRMHSSIADFISRLYYDGELVTDPEVDSRRTIELMGLDKTQRIFWFDVRDKEIRSGTSLYNLGEIAAIKKILTSFNDNLSGSSTSYSVGIITPYAVQRDRLQKALDPQNARWTNLEIVVATTHAFQGKDKQLILYSLVQTNPRSMRFVEDERLLNVSFSRSELALLIFGHQAKAKQNARLNRAIKLIKNTVTV